MMGKNTYLTNHDDLRLKKDLKGVLYVCRQATEYITFSTPGDLRFVNQSVWPVARQAWHAGNQTGRQVAKQRCMQAYKHRNHRRMEGRTGMQGSRQTDRQASK